MTKRKGRKPDTKIIYTPEQTQRYKSQSSRYEKGLKLAHSNLVHKIDDKTYRVESARSPIGYWQVEDSAPNSQLLVNWEGQLGGKLACIWRGESSKILLNVTWGKKTDSGIIKVTWEGERTDNIDCYEPLDSTTFSHQKVSGCGYLQLRVTYTWKARAVGTGNNRYGSGAFYGDFFSSTSWGAFYSEYSDGGTWESSAEAIGTQGFVVPSGEDDEGDEIVYVSYSEVVSFTEQQLGVFSIAQDVIDYTVSHSYLSDIAQVHGGGAPPEVVGVYHPEDLNPNCELSPLDFSPGGPDNNCDPNSETQKINWGCDHDISGENFSFIWTVANASSGIIKNEKGYEKTLYPCTPPVSGLTNIKLKSINKVVSNDEDDITWECEHETSTNPAEISLNWNIVNSGAGIIQNDKGFQQTLAFCTPPVPLEEAGIRKINFTQKIDFELDWECLHPISASENLADDWDIINPISGIVQSSLDITKTLVSCPAPDSNVSNVRLFRIDGVISDGTSNTWQCSYELTEDENSENWSLFDYDEERINFIVENDRGQLKTIQPCPSPYPSGVVLQDIYSIDGVNQEGENVSTCTCPDFSKSEEAFSTTKFPSMTQSRSWASSDAGCPTWEDGKRRCCHIVAVQVLKKKKIPVPDDLPTGEG